MPIDVKFNGCNWESIEITDEPELTILEFFKMLTESKTDPTTLVVILVKLQAGLDRSTLAGRFNYQIA